LPERRWSLEVVAIFGRGGAKEWEEEEGKKWKRRRGEGGGEKEERRERMGRGGGIKWRRWREGMFLKIFMEI
jgi:hypothetical protein